MEKRGRKRSVVIIGGGYAGLSCVAELRRLDPNLAIHLFDPHTDHCRLTALHKSFRSPLRTCLIPFSTLAKRFKFTHHRQSVSCDPETLKDCFNTGTIRAGNVEISFDALLIAIGGTQAKLPQGRAVFTLNDIRSRGGISLLDDLSQRQIEKPHITLVGAGATGIQILFEIDAALREKGIQPLLRLIDPHEECLSQLPHPLGDYTLRALTAKGIVFLPKTSYRGQHGDEIRLEESSSKERYLLPSDLTLLCPGISPTPLPMETSETGQVISEKRVLGTIFAAGDISRFRGRGLNALSAQAAIQKGMTVARNIDRLLGGRRLLPYDYREQGYFVSLGPDDAAGWVGSRSLLITGRAASLMKEGVEMRYELLLQGINTFIPPLFRG